MRLIGLVPAIVPAIVLAIGLSHAEARAADAAPLAPPVAPSPAPAQPPVARPPPPLESRALAVRVGGVVVATWTSSDVAKWKPLPPGPGGANAGGKSRLYSLKDALSSAVGPTARVASVTVSTGGSIALDERAWNDPLKSPVLWQNRRGLFKLGWVDAKNQLVAGQEIRDITGFDVVK